MKKSKLLAALAAAAVLAAGGAAFAGCGGDGHKHTFDTSEWGGKDATGHWHLATCGHDDEKGDFGSHKYGEDGKAQYCLCGYENPDYEAPATVTLDVGEGELGAGAATSYATVDGKIDGVLPEPTISKEHWHFVDWFDADDNPIVEAETVFTADTTIYARYARDNGVWAGETFINKLELNAGCTDHTQYWLGNEARIDLEKDDEISLYVNDELVEFLVDAKSTCVDKTVTDVKVTKATVTEKASFVMYLNFWTDSGNWQCEFTGTAELSDTTDTLPEGCKGVQIAVGAGKTITLYIVDPDGNVVNGDNAHNFRVYAWNGATKLFGEWNDSPYLNTAISTDVEIYNTTCWIIRWGTNSQTDNMSGMVADKAYVINLSASKSGIIEYTGEADILTPYEKPVDPEFVDGGYYLVGRGFSATDFGLNKDYYIDPVEGLEVNLAVGNLYKIIACKEQKPDWSVSPTYEMAAGKEKGFLNLPDGNGGNGTVKVAGKYTVTIVGEGADMKFVFTPDASLEPDLTVVKYDGYLVGSNFTVGANAVTSNGWQLNDFCRIDPENGLTVELTATSEFKIAASVNEKIDWDTYKTSDCVLKDGEFINASGNLKVSTPGTYKITVEYDEEGGATFTFELISAATPETPETPVEPEA